VLKCCGLSLFIPLITQNSQFKIFLTVGPNNSTNSTNPINPAIRR
jgi:hypothetical protein